MTPPCLLGLLCLLQASSFWSQASAWAFPTRSSTGTTMTTTRLYQAPTTSSSWFSDISTKDDDTEETSTSTSRPASETTTAQLLAQMLQLGAALDRGQAYNPTSGEYYQDRMQAAVQTIETFLEKHPNQQPASLDSMLGEWELVLSTVPHGIFRSSPFFLAIQQSYEYAVEKEINGEPKANLFFRLHELQTCSWGVSKIGRVAQHVTTKTLYSEFDTSIFSLTVIPILGWFKLLPTFGGCVVTAAAIKDYNPETGLLQMTVDYTTSRPVPGLSGLGAWIWNIKVPVGAIWKLLPWNQGRPADCQLTVKYVDDDFRIVMDDAGDYFVYTRPVVPRALDLANDEA